MSYAIILNILIVIVFIVAIAFIIMSVRKQRSSTRIAFNGNAGSQDGTSAVFGSNDIRSRTIKCFRCGKRAYGILGTKDVYRCQSCGYNTRKENTSAPTTTYSERSSV